LFFEKHEEGVVLAVIRPDAQDAIKVFQSPLSPNGNEWELGEALLIFFNQLIQFFLFVFFLFVEIEVGEVE